jgi:hypothetical protein
MTKACAAAFLHEDRPVLTVAREKGQRQLQHLVIFLEHDPDIDPS